MDSTVLDSDYTKLSYTTVPGIEVFSLSRMLILAFFPRKPLWSSKNQLGCSPATPPPKPLQRLNWVLRQPWTHPHHGTHCASYFFIIPSLACAFFLPSPPSNVMSSRVGAKSPPGIPGIWHSRCCPTSVWGLVIQGKYRGDTGQTLVHSSPFCNLPTLPLWPSPRG